MPGLEQARAVAFKEKCHGGAGSMLEAGSSEEQENMKLEDEQEVS